LGASVDLGGLDGCLDGGCAGQELGNLAQGLQRGQVLGLDGWGLRQPFLKDREDLDALDGINAQIGVQGHVEV
jgi:hypothetical protein